MNLWARLFGLGRIRIMKRWALHQKAVERDPFGKAIPKWADHLMIGGFRKQGWTAYDQRQRGKTVATGKWGDELYLMSDGSISCTSALTPKDPTT